MTEPAKATWYSPVELIGWYGTAAIVSAYALVSFDVFEADSAPYQLLNLTGALAIILLGVVRRVWQPVALNVVWFVVAAVTLVQILR